MIRYVATVEFVTTLTSPLFRNCVRIKVKEHVRATAKIIAPHRVPLFIEQVTMAVF